MREKSLEIVFIILGFIFAAVGYGFHQLETESYRLTPRNPDTLRIVTWNVGGADGYGGRSLRAEHVSHIGGVLNKLAADVILLQEITSDDQLQRLKHMLGGKWEVIMSSGGSRSLTITGQRDNLHSRERLTHGLQALAASYQSTRRLPVLLMNIHAHPYSAKARNILIGQATDALVNDSSDDLKILAGVLNLTD